MEKLNLVVKNSKNFDVEVEFIYQDTTTICFVSYDRFTFKSVAQLHDGDIYDRVIGEDIALQKALNKFSKKMYLMSFLFSKRIEKDIMLIKDAIKNKVKKVQKNYLKKI